MEPLTLFYILIGIIVINFLIDKVLDFLNAKHFGDELPEEIADVYDEEAYRKSQAYKKERFRFGILTSSISFVATLLFFFLDGFEFVDNMARSYSENNIVIALVFFGIFGVFFRTVRRVAS